ncbi:hypothetical protein F7731_23535 [Cytobacillus depressus]|uniref:Uncharacterized protein n=1 Tax=Cytobacillus depressus TaxID=1602942 RepID=A0A6L3V4H3_9BACI|nr:hypothetical protein [Cytobacillus depressus]KAB2328929.1 hypothetical protein F7731_23535 [Cytobacillus depressus]
MIQDSTGVYFSPAINVTGHNRVSIILQATQDGIVDVDVSEDGITWSTHEGMDLIADEKTSYQVLMDNNQHVRYSVNTAGTITASSIYMGGFVNG